MSTVTITLCKPIQVEGEALSELTLREPTVKDLLAQDKITGETAQMAAMLEALADIPRSAVLQISAKDFVRCVQVVSDFLDDGQPTGAS